MNVFKLFVFAALLAPLLSKAQIGYDEYNKYWYYRHRLTTEFMVPGKSSILICSGPSGYSIPAETTFSGPGGAYPDNRMINFVDGTISLGYYLGVLATEFLLLKESSWNTEQTKKELYWAMSALERLDSRSRTWFYPDDNTCEGINGYFVRDDVFESIFSENPVFNRYKIDGQYNYRSDYLKSRDATNKPDMATVTTDQISHLYEGLALIKKCFEEYPNENFNGYKFRERAMRIAESLAFYLNSKDWIVKDEKGYQPKESMQFRREGYGYLIAKAAGFISDDYSSKDFLSSVSPFTEGSWQIKIKVLTRTILWNLIGRARDFTVSHITSATAVGNPFNITDTKNLLDHVDGNSKYDLGYYNLLHSYLRDRNDLLDGKWYSHLKKAPCWGITYRPVNSVIEPGHAYYNGVSGWVSTNRWVRYSKRYFYINTDGHYKANGLDYMILYNLYLLYYKSRNPGLVGDLPFRPPGYSLTINSTNNTLNYDLESYNSITINSSVNFNANTTRRIIANNAIHLLNGFSFKAEDNKVLVISSRGNVNACGYPLDEYGEPIGDPGTPLRIAQEIVDEEEKINNSRNNYVEKKNEYKPLSQYLEEREVSKISGKESFFAKTYPNPSSENSIKLYISSETIRTVSIVMYNSMGQIEQDFGDFYINSFTETKTLNMSQKPKAGVYFIHINSSKGNKVFKQIFK